MLTFSNRFNAVGFKQFHKRTIIGNKTESEKKLMIGVAYLSRNSCHGDDGRWQGEERR